MHRPRAGSRSRQEQRVEGAPLASAAAADSPLSHSGKRDRALRARPRHPPLAAVPIHLHTGGPGLRAASVHWLRSPSLSLHKTHMELHVHRVGSSMKTQRTRAPLLVSPSGPFHFRPRSLPLKTARVHQLGERGVARTTAEQGSSARDGDRSRGASRQTLAEAQAPGGCCPPRQSRDAAPAATAARGLPAGIFHSRIHIHSFTLIHSPLGAEAAGAPGAPPPTTTRLTLVPDLPGWSASKWPFLFLKPCVPIFGSGNSIIFTMKSTNEIKDVVLAPSHVIREKGPSCEKRT